MTPATALLFLLAIIGLALAMLGVLVWTHPRPPQPRPTRWTREMPEGPP